MEILRFISAIFYGGPDRLMARSVHVAVDGVVPLNFYVAQGQEHQVSGHERNQDVCS